MTFAEIRAAIWLLANSLSFRATARKVVVDLFKDRYFDFRVYVIHRRIWGREMRTWAAVFARDLRFAVKATLAVVRHHRSVRPRYASDEWNAFRDNLERDFNYRHRRSDIRPAPYVAPWSRGYPLISPETPPVTLANLPWPWPRGMVFH